MDLNIIFSVCSIQKFDVWTSNKIKIKIIAMIKNLKMMNQKVIQTAINNNPTRTQNNKTISQIRKMGNKKVRAAAPVKTMSKKTIRTKCNKTQIPVKSKRKLIMKKLKRQ